MGAGARGSRAHPGWLVRRVAARVPDVVFAMDVDVDVGGARRVALSLDDGPDPRVTPRVLDVLARHGARATFFALGARAEREPGLLRRVVAEGHELGNHTWEDEPSAWLAPAAFAGSLARTQVLLGTFAPVGLWRPGSGWFTRAMLAEGERQGLRCVLGSVYPLDAALPSARLATAWVQRRVHPGAVVILHERPHLPGALERILPALRARGYRVVTVSELLRGSG